MKANEIPATLLSQVAISRIQIHIKHLVTTYFKVAERHINSKNEYDLEEYAKTLMAFSAAIGAHIRAQNNSSGHDKSITDQEIDFYQKCLNLTRQK